MKCTSTPLKAIIVNREYVFTSKELKNLLEIKGNIIDIEVYSAANSYQREKNHKIIEKDQWIINTKETQENENKSKK